VSKSVVEEMFRGSAVIMVKAGNAAAANSVSEDVTLHMMMQVALGDADTAIGADGRTEFALKVTEDRLIFTPKHVSVELMPIPEEDIEAVTVTVETDTRLSRMGISKEASTGSNTGDGGSKTEGRRRTMNTPGGGASHVPIHETSVWKENSSDSAPLTSKPAAGTKMTIGGGI
jgi:hypothetical protein